MCLERKNANKMKAKKIQSEDGKHLNVPNRHHLPVDHRLVAIDKPQLSPDRLGMGEVPLKKRVTDPKSVSYDGTESKKVDISDPVKHLK